MRERGPADVAATAALTVRAELLGAVCEAAREAVGARATSVALLDDTAHDLVFVAAAGERAQDIVGARFNAAEGVAGAVLAHGRPVSVDDVLSEPRFARDIAEEIGYAPDRMIVAPVPGPAAATGVVYVLDPAQGGADRVVAFAEHAAAALAVERSARAMLDALLADVR